MCEWLKQAVLKTAVRETVPGVRIPLPPPYKAGTQQDSIDVILLEIEARVKRCGGDMRLVLPPNSLGSRAVALRFLP
jgi:hypothetical protein